MYRARTTIPAATVLAWLLTAAFTGVAAAQDAVAIDTLHAAAGSRLYPGAAAMARSMDILDRTEIEALPATSILDVLARAFGVDLLPRSAAQADVAIRGSSFEQVLVMVDGVPMNDDQTGHFHLSMGVPLDAVERIEVLRGPASALYGSAAVGGVINIVTRRDAEELSARAEAGSFGGAAAEVGAGFRAGGLTGRAGAGHDRSDGHRAGTDHRATSGLLTLDADIAGGKARLDGSYARRDFGADGFYAPYDSYEETRTAAAAASWRSMAGAWSIAPRLSVRRNEDDFILLRDDPDFYHNTHTNDRMAAELVLQRALSSRVRVAFGADAARSDLDSNTLGSRTERRTAVFGELAAGSPAATLGTAGIRLDHHSTFGSFVSATAGGSFRPAAPLRIRASAASGFRAPNWTERYYEDPVNIGDPNLEVERFWTAELGAELQRGATSAEAVVFVRRARELIDWSKPEGAGEEVPWRTMNVASATFRGLETEVRTTLATVALTGRAALIGVAADDVAGYTSKYALRPLTRSLSLQTDVALARRASLSLRGARFDRPDAAAWGVVDARLTADFQAAQVFAGVTNLFDASWRDVSDRPAPGRSFSAGLRLRR
ncbi:MAG: TonB-dependent receptor [Gemmatimonadota bacterium]